MRLRAFFDKYKQEWWPLFLMVTAALFLTLLIPKEGAFPYEFQLSKPWLHEAYFAPFDIPIRKSDEEMKREKDSLIRHIVPYFRKVDESAKEMAALFEKESRALLYDSLSSGIPPEAVKTLIAISRNGLDEVYNKGILGHYEPPFPGASAVTASFMLLHNNVSEASDTSMVFSLRKAYEYLSLKVRSAPGLPGDWFLKQLDLNRYLTANLLYDKETTQLVQDEKIRLHSDTKGVFPAQALIVGENEIVNREKFDILRSLKAEYAEQGQAFRSSWKIWLGNGIMVLTLLFCLLSFLRHMRPSILPNKYVGFIFLMVVTMVSIAILCVNYKVPSLYVVPFTILPIVLRSFFDARTAIFTHLTVVLIVAFFAPNSFEFVVLNMAVGVVATFTSESIYQRSMLFSVAIYITITYSVLFLGFQALYGEEFSLASLQPLVWFVAHGFLVLLSYYFIFIFERIFGFVSNVRLIELVDSNNPLLRKLSERAPGTFQHSLQVANIAEEVVRAIGGNPLLVRAGALYHDVGKIENPQYFIENQHGELNVHDDAPFEVGAGIIIHHVEAGVEMAQKARIPIQIIDFIRTHHGRSTALYFYRSFLKEYPGRESEIDKFTYPGPNPTSKEGVVLMMSDAVEAASRSLKERTGESISSLVNKIVDQQFTTGLYNDAPITLREVQMAREALIRKLMNIHHVRIEYPE